MRILTATAIIAVLASTGATAASARPGALDDKGLVSAARCVGLANSTNLGAVSNVAEINLWLQNQIVVRDPLPGGRAKSAEIRAKKEADGAQGAGKDKLIAERDGPCSTILS